MAATSQKPLVIAYHLCWTAYGCWLPNDPRGSGGSLDVRSPRLARLGESHYGRTEVQPPSETINAFYTKATPMLLHPPIRLREPQFETAARGLAEALAKHRYTCYACAILPDHVHMLLRKHRHSAEEMIAELQGLSRERLIFERIHPVGHPVWTDGGWKNYLDRPSAVREVIRYIESNPERAGLAKQDWPFVTPYNNWPLHPGHSPNSPYARRLRLSGDE